MTKKERELVIKLNYNMPEFTGTPVEVEKKIAMYIYLELGKSKVFDEKYFLGNSKQKEKIIKMARNSRHNIDPVIENRKVVCITIANLYKRLLKDFGISSIATNLYAGDDHISNIINFSNGEKIIADIQKDLENIQTKSMTKNFGQKYFKGLILQDRISDDELFELHKACGYVNSKEEYKDVKINELKKRVQGLSPNEILSEIVHDKDINTNQEDIGYIEMFKYYSNLIYKVAPKYHKQGIYYCNCYRVVPDVNGNDEREYSMCMYSVYNDKIDAYLYSKVDKMFKKTEMETFNKLERTGLYLGKNPQEKGVKLLRRYMNRNIEEVIKAKHIDNYNKNKHIFEKFGR